jgi:hypothetical protein
MVWLKFFSLLLFLSELTKLFRTFSACLEHK